MKKFMVMSGFLGAGKTTTMIALAKYWQTQGKKASIIANDLGAKNLVDREFTEDCGCDVTEIAGDCICYQTETLVERLRRLLNGVRADLVMSDIPGCGVGALDHVYHKLNESYHGEFELAPFTVVADPERLRTITPEAADIHLPKEMNYLFRAQLQEADVILLNKIDLLTAEEVERYLAFLREFCPKAQVFAVSAKKQTNLAEAADYLWQHIARLEKVDVGYGGPEFIAAEEKLCWYNRKFFAKSLVSPIDGNAFARDLMNAIRKKLQAIDGNVPHLKLHLYDLGGGRAKFSLLGVDYDIQADRLLEKPAQNLQVIVNARAACEADQFGILMDDALKEICQKYQMRCRVFFTECFGMMEEGR